MELDLWILFLDLVFFSLCFVGSVFPDLEFWISVSGSFFPDMFFVVWFFVVLLILIFGSKCVHLIFGPGVFVLRYDLFENKVG